MMDVMFDGKEVLRIYEMYYDLINKYTDQISNIDVFLAVQHLTRVRDSMDAVLEKVSDLQEDCERAKEFFESRRAVVSGKK